MQNEASPLGVFGGTFDPIHFGHLRLAQDALAACALGAVRFVPAGQPMHRGRTGASAHDRLAMVRLALQGQPQFELDEAEVLSDAPSYTVPTLERLRQQLDPQRPLVLLLGVDAFLGLASWHRWRELFDLAHIAVATRPGYSLNFVTNDTLAQTETNRAAAASALKSVYQARLTPSAESLLSSAAGHIHLFDMTPMDISATAVRAQVVAGARPSTLVPEAVLDYIEANQLYL